MKFDSILAVSDFAPESAHALERAAILARQHQMTLRLIFLAEAPDAFIADPLARIALRARQLARRHEIVVTAAAHSASLAAVLTSTCASTLLVMGPLSRRGWWRFYRSTPLDQAVRSSVCPLLVVKQTPLTAYERVLVAIDLSPCSKPLINFAGWFSTPSVLTLFHATDTVEDSKLRSVSVSPEAIQANRLDTRQKANDRLTRLIGTMDLPLPRSSDRPLVFDVGNGDPAYSAAQHQVSTQADLVVVGRRRRLPWLPFFTGSVAQRLAKWADGDVLIAPLDQTGSAASAGDDH